MGAAEQEAETRRETEFGRALANAETKAAQDAQQYRRPKPGDLQAQLTTEQRRDLETQRHLLNGLYQAKLHCGDNELGFADVQIIHNLMSIADLLNQRARAK